MDFITDVTSKFAEKIAKEATNALDKAIREAIEKGFKYLVIENELTQEKGNFSCTQRFHYTNSFLGISDYEIIDLDKLREFYYRQYSNDPLPKMVFKEKLIRW